MPRDNRQTVERAAIQAARELLRTGQIMVPQDVANEMIRNDPNLVVRETRIPTPAPTPTFIFDEPCEAETDDFGLFDDGIDHEPICADDFPAIELERWSLREREDAVDQFFRQMDYRIRWIFNREEREGISRQRFVHPFSPDDFSDRRQKHGKKHQLDTSLSEFYDWKIGGTDFLIRMESFRLKKDNTPCLRCHYIHNPTNKQLGYSDRIWNGSQYSEVNMVWAGA